jgi:hypothetical protein
VSVPGIADVWRCFYCDETFTDRAAAELHFGPGGALRQDQPACRINIAEYRAMEEIVRRYADDDSDMHRAMYRMQSEHAVALRRAEEDGYARGLRDAVLHPMDSGLRQSSDLQVLPLVRELLKQLANSHRFNVANLLPCNVHQLAYMALELLGSKPGAGNELPENRVHDAAAEAISFSLETPDGLAFLRAWQAGDFDRCRREWPEAPSTVYEGADVAA